MVSAICKAKDRSTCRYHGTVDTMNRYEKELAEFTVKNGYISNEILDKYIEARNQVAQLEQQKWDEPTTFIPQPSNIVVGAVTKTQNLQEGSIFWLREATGMTDEQKETFQSMYLEQIYQFGYFRVNKKLADYLLTHTTLNEEAIYNLDDAYRKSLDKDRRELQEPLLSIGDAAQSGELLPEVAVPMNLDEDFGGAKDYNSNNTTVFFRTSEEGDPFPDFPYAIRIQADRPLSKEQARHLAGLLGYTYRTTVRGESLGEVERDTPFSFIVSADTTKSASDDVGMALEELQNSYPKIVKEGTPLRKTDRAGAGTKNTRLIEPYDDPNIKLSFYFDSAS